MKLENSLSLEMEATNTRVFKKVKLEHFLNQERQVIKSGVEGKMRCC